MNKISTKPNQVFTEFPNGEWWLWRGIDLGVPRDTLKHRLQTELAWAQTPIIIYGREVMQPRLSAWYGDADAQYRYSGVMHAPMRWTPILLDIKSVLESLTGASYNSVLCNWYRSGQDSMGWHSDDEPELGAQPIIASLSVGGARRFLLQHRKIKAMKWSCSLGDGDLLLMKGDTQKNYRHSVPKTAREVESRINLTFRRIFAQ